LRKKTLLKRPQTKAEPHVRKKLKVRRCKTQKRGLFQGILRNKGTENPKTKKKEDSRRKKVGDAVAGFWGKRKIQLTLTHHTQNLHKKARPQLKAEKEKKP